MGKKRERRRERFYVTRFFHSSLSYSTMSEANETETSRLSINGSNCRQVFSKSSPKREWGKDEKKVTVNISSMNYNGFSRWSRHEKQERKRENLRKKEFHKKRIERIERGETEEGWRKKQLPLSYSSLGKTCLNSGALETWVWRRNSLQERERERRRKRGEKEREKERVKFRQVIKFKTFTVHQTLINYVLSPFVSKKLPSLVTHSVEEEWEMRGEDRDRWPVRIKSRRYSDHHSQYVMWEIFSKVLAKKKGNISSLILFFFYCSSHINFSPKKVWRLMECGQWNEVTFRSVIYLSPRDLMVVV